MRILKISGKNLASLAGLFSVDFEAEPLASSGLFAISGPTGAGKSTLLDALCLALYDDTPRLLKVGGRSNLLPDVGSDTISAQETRTLLRRGTADGHAEVDFVGNDGVSYRARWSVRRSYNKTGGTLQAPTMSLHQLPGLQPMGGTKTEVKLEIVQRIGLSFEQFTRAVLLAQNEFSTFLKTEDNERGELLETLTGSTIYSQISMRAFERNKREQDTLRRLTERLADGRPLGADARRDLDARSASADAALAALDAQKTQLDQQLHWFGAADRLEHSLQLARQGLHASEQAFEQAAARREQLAQLDAVQAARALVDEIGRLDAERAHTEQAAASHQAEAVLASARLEAATAAAQQGASRVLAAEHARRAAAPQLDRAKALDARLDAMQAAHQQAHAASRGADQDNENARASLQQQQAQHAQLVAAQTAGAAWLAQHQPWQTLAQSWPRWDLLFTQAENTATQAQQAAQALTGLQASAQASAAQQAEAMARLSAASATLQGLEQRRQEAQSLLAAIDTEAVLAERRHLDQRRELLAGAATMYQELLGQQTRRDQLASRQQQVGTDAEQAAATVTRELARAAGLTAALTQAERSLKSAQAACAASVENLRATLAPDHPCPVCGALEHPYRHADQALRAMLASLQGEVMACRRAYDDHLGRLAGAQAAHAGSSSQLAPLALEIATLQESIAMLAPRWQQSADRLAIPAGAPADAWLAAQRGAAQVALQSVEQQELALRRASGTRAQAQAACDEATASHRQLADSAAQAASALAHAEAQHAALAEKRLGLQAQLAFLLDELDGAFRHADTGHDDWKDNWHGAPARFHADRQAETRQWLQQRSAHDERLAALASADIELKAAGALLQRTEREANAARSAFATVDAETGAMRAERQTLWNGGALQSIETGLAQAIEHATAAQQTLQLGLRAAEQVRIRVDETLAQARLRLGALDRAAQQAAARLDAWLAQWQPAPQDGILAPEMLHQHVHGLLAIPDETRERERAALRALEVQLANAAAVLHERQAQCALHRQQAPQAPQGDEVSAASLAAVSAALAVERKAAHAAAAALQLELAQDQARCVQAASMLAAIGSQEAVEQRWARMNELIGSSDGKKFRNYAQQFTLDVLLGYANAHLHQLARRYQLERIHNPAHPSLGLMVRDQDMGGELRSVHSLSGGESFLVSLALALGLASLSSNRVRVESLFIDEGFGSLDAETLRVAMDALDGLQTLGRKVGVISHVQEMTERIATRILVRPAAGGRSTVSVQ